MGSEAFKTKTIFVFIIQKTDHYKRLVVLIHGITGRNSIQNHNVKIFCITSSK